VSDEEQESSTSRRAGGAATGGGMNFQAAVTAIALVHMARGRQLGWLAGLVDDTPVAVHAETGGAGDDIRLILRDGSRVEIQAKKGLRATSELWNAMLALSSGLADGSIDFGLLAVSPTSSRTITNDLARDVVRIGEGRKDQLSPLADRLVGELKALALDPETVCRHLRIQTVHALAADQASIAAAKAELAHLLDDEAQVPTAWNALMSEAGALIERRGGCDLGRLSSALRSLEIRVAAVSAAPLPLLERLTRWTMAANATYSIVGLDRPLSVDDAWIELTAIVREDNLATEQRTLEEALRSYQEWESRSGSRDVRSVDPETLCRFVTKTVLVAGPGMGKTTLLKRIARRYSEDGVPVLKMRLSNVATRMRSGDTFEEAVFSLGLDGSGISPAAARAAGFSNWTLLCDGLDECGALQEEVASGVARFAEGHPGSRILLTTRPIGYRAVHFRDWRHYDLPALSYSDAYASAAKLLEPIVELNHEGTESAWDISRRELFDTPAAKIVGRTPLMLSLAVAIIARGQSLPSTRERLYEAIFSLIDEAPNARMPEPPAPVSVLREFLNLLGWSLTERPLDSIEATQQRCAAWLSEQLDLKPLAATAEVERYVEYWEHVGLVERVGHGHQRVLSFIHKSFGEFAAARHLRSLEVSGRTAALTEIVGKPNWAEVLRFAGLLGLGESVASMLAGTAGSAQIAFAVEIAADAKPPPGYELRRAIFTAAAGVVGGDRRRAALQVGAPLLRAASRFPGEVGPLVGGLLHSQQAWTRLIGWACAVAAGPAHYRLDDLIEALPEVVGSIQPRFRRSLGGGIELGTGGEREIGEAFALGACEEILDRLPEDVADDLVRSALGAEQLATTGFLRLANALVREKGRFYAIGTSRPLRSGLFDVPEGYYEAFVSMWEAIFEAFELPPTTAAEPRDKPPLLHLSAFIEASNMNNVELGDVWGWASDFDRPALRATLTALVHVTRIDVEKLREDLVQARIFVRAGKARRFTSLFELTSQVDPPPPCWTHVRELALKPDAFEAAIRHRAQWVKWIAANLLQELVSKEELAPIVERLMATGRGYTLWAAAGLAAELTPEKATELVLERLSKPLVPGCRHLFPLLAGSRGLDPAVLVKALRAGLLAEDVHTAIAAAELAVAVEPPPSEEALDLLEAAWRHWQEHEEPYPNKGGAVPDSPRAAILKAQWRTRQPGYAAIKPLLTDPRSDVSQYAGEILAKRMATPEGERLALIGDTGAGQISAHHLSQLLKKGVTLDPAERAAAENLLRSPLLSARFQAMALLDERYMSRDRIRSHAQRLSADDDDRIRDRAYSLLESEP